MPVSLGVLHQAVAFVLFSWATLSLHQVRAGRLSKNSDVPEIKQRASASV
ncbi:hypothetical protein [Pontibacter rugosus]